MPVPTKEPEAPVIPAPAPPKRTPFVPLEPAPAEPQKKPREDGDVETCRLLENSEGQRPLPTSKRKVIFPKDWS